MISIDLEIKAKTVADADKITTFVRFSEKVDTAELSRFVDIMGDILKVCQSFEKFRDTQPGGRAFELPKAPEPVQDMPARQAEKIPAPHKVGCICKVCMADGGPARVIENVRTK